MMNPVSVSPERMAQHIKCQGIGLQIGPFIIHVQSSIPSVVEGIKILYADYPKLLDPDFADFYVRLSPPRNLRRWYRSQVDFYLDGFKPFKPLPLDHAFPFFEWGVNWCIAGNSNQYLILHAATVEKNGQAIIMPGAPGSGKSTLCAALVSRGWRLLTDELTLIPLGHTQVVPVARPISLKNESIEVIRRFAPQEIIGPVAHDTNKGDVAHMKAPLSSIERVNEPATVRWVIFPKYAPQSKAELRPESKGYAFMRIATNSFNYSMLELEGFEATAEIIEACDCYDFSYASLEEAVAVFEDLVSQKFLLLPAEASDEGIKN